MVAQGPRKEYLEHYQKLFTPLDVNTVQRHWRREICSAVIADLLYGMQETFMHAFSNLVC